MRTYGKWSTIHQNYDVIGLVKLIRSATYSGRATKKAVMTYIKAEDGLTHFRQSKRMSNIRYMEIFVSKVEIYEHLGGEPGQGRARVKDQLIDNGVNVQDWKEIDESDMAKAREQCREEYLANLFITPI